MNKTGYITLAVLVVILVAASMFYLHVQKQNKSDALQDSSAANVLVAPSGEGYTDLLGNPVSFDQYIGKNLLAFAWASWCPSCGEQLKILADAAQADQDIKVLAFNRAESINTVKSYLQFYGLENTVELVLDPDDHFFSSIDGYSMPETVLFNSSGDIIHHERGPVTPEELSYLLQKFETTTSQN